MSDPRRYLVIFEHTDGTGYSAWLPDLPGCVAAADTREECEQLIREAIALHLAGLRQDGEPIPEPTSVDAAIVSVPAA
ncbi:MAG TPA: type II toxin-antitoxin system HicB family antitoxin [Mycobacteriales bacterium]|nr:type II toxin-antitoxin system HicB family antitoxin [Mycobacteriales bacterium]